MKKIAVHAWKEDKSCSRRRKGFFISSFDGKPSRYFRQKRYDHARLRPYGMIGPRCWNLFSNQPARAYAQQLIRDAIEELKDPESPEFFFRQDSVEEIINLDWWKKSRAKIRVQAKTKVGPVLVNL